MAMHPEVMPAVQQRTLHQLAAFATGRGFYLGGGTAVAIQIGHRESVDLDWFTGDEIPDPLALGAELRRAGVDFETTDLEKGTLHGTAGGVKLSFLEYRYPLLRPALEWAEYGCRLAALEDLACMKLSAIAGRGAKKDFIDLYAFGTTTFGLDRMLALYQEKFETDDVGHLIYSLTYFDDADPDDMPRMLWDVDWEEVKRTVQAWVRDFVRRQAPPGLGGEESRP